MVRFAGMVSGDQAFEAPGVPTEFEVAGERLTITLRRLTRRQIARYADAVRHDDAEAAENALLDYGIIGWDGVQDEKGNPVPFTRENLDVVLGLDADLANEVIAAILRINELAGNRGGKQVRAVPLDQPNETESTSTSASAP